MFECASIKDLAGLKSLVHGNRTEVQRGTYLGEKDV